MKLVVDTNILGKLCHPKNKKNKPIAVWFSHALRSGEFSFFLPAIADYELRRKLIHMVERKQATQESIERLDGLAKLFDFIELEAKTLKVAARLWADARLNGTATAPDNSIDGDVLLAAQAKEVDGLVLTENRKHLSRYVGVKTLDEVIANKPG